MPRLDEYHEAVKNALVKDGWTITDDPFTIDFEDATLFADLAAERTIAAQKENEKIAIEIKMFGSKSAYDDLEKAFGQYQVYRSFLRQIEPNREIYLAVSSEKQQKSFLVLRSNIWWLIYKSNSLFSIPKRRKFSNG